MEVWYAVRCGGQLLNGDAPPEVALGNGALVGIGDTMTDSAAMLRERDFTEYPPWLLTRCQDVLGWALERGRLAPIDDPCDFPRLGDQHIWRVILDLNAAGRSFDYPSVRAEIERRGLTDEVGAEYLLERSRNTVRPTEHALESAATEIKQAAQNRRARALLTRYVTSDVLDFDRLAADIDALRSVANDVEPPLLDDAAVLTLPDIEYLAPGVPARSLVALIGDSGIGKTFVVIDFALSVVTRKAWNGLPIETSGPAVLVAAEGAPAPRIGGWKIAHGFPVDEAVGLHTWSGAVNLLEPAAVSAFIAAVKPLKPALVILDTLARCMVGGDENSARDMGLAVAAMDRIRVQLGATVLVIHHTNKAGTSERGSGALRGACDTVLHLQHADDLLQLTCSKQKDSEPFTPINLALTPAHPGSKTCIVRLASEVIADDTLSDAQGKALHALTELFGDAGAKSTEWEEAIPSMHRATFYRARKVLVDRGYVREASQRFYPTGKRPVASSRTACRTSSDHLSREVA